MRTSTKWLLTATLAAGVAPFATLRAADDAGAPAQRERARAAEQQPLALPPGFTAKDVKATGEVKTGLAKLTERAYKKGDWNSLLAELSTQDKDRTREFKNADQTKIDSLVDKIHQQWKAKYGKDFDLDEKKVVFDDRVYQIVQGEVSDPAVALANWPLPAAPAEAVTAGERNRKAIPDDQKNLKKEERTEKLTKGRDVAIVRFPAAWGMPEMNVSMLHELPTFYRVDIPNDRSGEQIYNDLVAQLTWLGDHADRWPNDINDGYRLFAQRAVAAVYGVQPMAKASS
ncbi:MAG TPA: hypothetical protein VG269_01730 [Tepidisphaeraceae bacterium]|jgi:hypothetical protein|nr:hypothetical protein [Tepidisphaeraceae bacterium]